MVSHPENGSDSPIGSDRDRGRDIVDVHPSQIKKDSLLPCFVIATT